MEVTPLKMRSLVKNLSQLRYARFKLPELFAVLEHLGWHIRPTVDVHELDGREDYRTEKDARHRLAKLKAQEVRTKPAKPETGRWYIADPKYEETIYGHTVTFGGWEADEAWEVSDPSGHHSFVMVPDPHARVRKRDRIHVDRLSKWLLEHTNVVRQAEALVEDYERQRRVQLADTNSGTCGVCLRNIKLEDESGGRQVMVLHGYKRPGTGHTQGRCMGVGYMPYELSVDATTMVLDSYERSLSAIDKYIESLIAPDLTEFVDDGRSKATVVTKAQAGATWRMLLDEHIAKQRQLRFNIKHERDIFRWLVNSWRLRPLPVPGQPAINWYDEASRHVRRT